MLSNRYRGEQNIAGAIGNLGTTSPQGMSYTQQPVNIIPLQGAIGNQGPTGAAGGALGNASFYYGPQIANAPDFGGNTIDPTKHRSAMRNAKINNLTRNNPNMSEVEAAKRMLGVSLPPI